jgi:hypothetical protein
MMDIKNSADYQALKKLASALWKKDNHFHGAAVLIGAGLTRGAAQTSVSKQRPALWSDLTCKLRSELGGPVETNSLKLAEEYAAYHGKQALRDFLKREIPDAAWQPGEMHKQLLSLPWNEVLTTNWDSLLERASEQINKPLYSVVRQQEDLAHAVSPRIVKLHGTVNLSEDLVFTEEDYRHYPQRHAAFVNFARQVFIENELCLLGFSAEDGNFLQWAGWVRDHLSSHSRRIYLVGALKLTSSRRKYLESINIAPIDLAPMVAEYDDLDHQHEAALKLFIDELTALKPKNTWDWRPTDVSLVTGSNQEFDRRRKDIEYQAHLLTQQLPIFEKDRLEYPGWLICPNGIRERLNRQISDPWPSSKNLAAMKQDEREKLLYEIAWRDSVTFDIINPHLVQDMLRVCDPAIPTALSKRQQIEIALILLQSTRWLDQNQVEGVAEKTSAILEKYAIHWNESLNSLYYHQALLARDELDYPKLTELTNKIAPHSPIWQMRKASLLTEIGESKPAQELVEQAYKALQSQFRVERNSLTVQSQLAWAHWLYKAFQQVNLASDFEKFPRDYDEALCSPRPILEKLTDEATQALNKQDKKRIEPNFSLGSYKDNSKTITFGDNNHPVLFLQGLTAAVGIPLFLEAIVSRDLVARNASKIAYLSNLDDLRFSLAIRAANSDSNDGLNRVFSAIEVAKFSEIDASDLLKKCLSAINYWKSNLPSNSAAIGRLQVFLEVLSRIVTRADTIKAVEIFRFATSLGKEKNFHDSWLFQSLDHLIQNTLRSIPQQVQKTILLDALLFPLATEIGKSQNPSWPNPVIYAVGVRVKKAEIDRRISEIIEQLGPNSNANRSALERLLPLHQHGYLTKQESEKLTEKIWGKAPNYQALPETGLFKFLLLALPSNNPQAVRALIATSLYKEINIEQIDIYQWIEMANAAQNKTANLLPSPDQATSLFNSVVHLRQKESAHPFDQSEQIGSALGYALTFSIVKSLPIEQLGEENFNRVLKFMESFNEPSVLLALPYFVKNKPEHSTRIEKIISECLQKRESKFSNYAAWAIVKWREIDSTAPIEKLIVRLVYLIGSGRTRGLAGWIDAANELLKNAWLNSEQIQSLKENIPVVFESTNYVNIDIHDQWNPVDIPLIRTACAGIAKTILQKAHSNDSINHLVSVAKNDPIPEVRHAAEFDSLE